VRPFLPSLGYTVPLDRGIGVEVDTLYPATARPRDRKGVDMEEKSACKIVHAVACGRPRTGRGPEDTVRQALGISARRRRATRKAAREATGRQGAERTRLSYCQAQPPAEEVTGGRWFYVLFPSTGQCTKLGFSWKQAGRGRRRPARFLLLDHETSLGSLYDDRSTHASYPVLSLLAHHREARAGVAVFLPPSAVSTALVSSSSSSSPHPPVLDDLTGSAS
jgi:hypothetical protein